MAALNIWYIDSSGFFLASYGFTIMCVGVMCKYTVKTLLGFFNLWKDVFH